MNFFILTFVITIFAPDSIIGYRICNGLRSDFSDFVFTTLTNSGSKYTLSAALLLYGSLGGKESFSDLKALTTAAIASSSLVFALKLLTNRERPSGPCCRTNSSFPSGHASGVFLIATYFSSRYKKLTIPLYIWAAGVGISRIYLRKHWPTDVIAGAIIGIVSGKLAFKYRSRISAIQLYP